MAAAVVDQVVEGSEAGVQLPSSRGRGMDFRDGREEAKSVSLRFGEAVLAQHAEQEDEQILVLGNQPQLPAEVGKRENGAGRDVGAALPQDVHGVARHQGIGGRRHPRRGLGVSFRRDFLRQSVDSDLQLGSDGSGDGVLPDLAPAPAAAPGGHRSRLEEGGDFRRM